MRSDGFGQRRADFGLHSPDDIFISSLMQVHLPGLASDSGKEAGKMLSPSTQGFKGSWDEVNSGRPSSILPNLLLFSSPCCVKRLCLTPVDHGRATRVSDGDIQKCLEAVLSENQVSD